MEKAYFTNLCGKRRLFLNNHPDIRPKQQRNAAVHHDPPAETRQTGFLEPKGKKINYAGNPGKLCNRATRRRNETSVTVGDSSAAANAAAAAEIKLPTFTTSSATLRERLPARAANTFLCYVTSVGGNAAVFHRHFEINA